MTSPNPNPPTGNISLDNNPFIWGNIALIAGVPWLLALSMAGLAVGDPVFPAWFEIFLLGFPAILLVTWVQWQQPISPFSLWFIAKPTESLSDRDRQILTLVKQNQNGWYVTGWIATAVAIFMSAIFCKIYISAPLAQAIAPFPAGLRLFGIVWAEICFLLSNVLLQAGIVALRIKLTAESELSGLQPFAAEKVKNSFTNIGCQSPQILKFFEEDALVEVKNDLPQVEASEQSPSVNESQDHQQDVAEIETSAFVAEVSPEEVSEVIDLVADVESEHDAIADITEESISEPVELISDFEVEELEPIDINESEPEQLIAEIQIETTLEQEIGLEAEELEPIEFITEPELEEQLVEEAEELEISAIVAEESVVETISEPEVITENISEIAEVINLDDQLVEEAEELEISAIVAEESVVETISGENEEPEIDQEIDQIIVENDIESILDAQIAEETSELDDFETQNVNSDKEPELTFLDIPDSSLESNLEEDDGQADANLESSGEEKFAEDDRQELNSVEAVENPEIEEIAKTTLTSDDKRSLDFLKKSRKTGGSPKKHGFGKSVKRDHNVVATPETIEPESAKVPEQTPVIEEPLVEAELDFIAPIPESEIVQELDDENKLEPIAIPSEQESEVLNNNETQDFDDELDELIAFNVYVENILKEYLEDTDEESENIENNAEMIEVSESTVTAEQISVNEDALDEEISEPSDPSIVFDPALEAIAIAQDNVETFTENSLDLETQVPQESAEEISSEAQAHKDSRYLVQEFLVDKFLARLEELNSADKANKATIESTTENISEPDPEVDEFADLEALLDRKPLTENPDTGDLSDRNS